MNIPSSEKSIVSQLYLDVLAGNRTISWTKIAATCLCVYLTAVSAFAAEKKVVIFNHGFNVLSCEEAIKFRDGELFLSYSDILDKYDPERETRINKIVQDFSKHANKLSKEWDHADKQARRKIAAAAAGLLIGEAASYYSKTALNGAKNLTDIEKRALNALSERGTSWVVFFGQLSINKEPDMKTLVGMPATFLMTFFDMSVAGKVLTFGTTGIDIMTALGERMIAENDFTKQSEILQKGAEKMLRSSRKVQLHELNKIKNDIDAQCK